MMQSFVVFAIAVAIVWVAGGPLARTTDAIAGHLGLGQNLAGAIILAIVTNLPEAAIATSAVLHGNSGLAIGNILGGIAVQMLVLVVLDRRLASHAPLATLASSGQTQIETLLVSLILILVMVGPLVAGIGSVGGLSIGEGSVLLVWVLGLFLLRGQTGAAAKSNTGQPLGWKPVGIFLLASLATLVGGVGLEMSSDALAQHFGISGVLFGATVLAAATSLPELSTGLASVKRGEYQLALSDIVGGNAFLPVLLALTSLLAGSSMFAQIDQTSTLLSALGAVMCLIYAGALLIKPQRRWLGFGPESIAMTVVFVCGIWVVSLTGG